MRLGMRVHMNLIQSTSTCMSCKCLLFTIYKSSSPGESMRVMESSECPPRNRNVSYWPQKLILIRIRVMGGVWSVLSSNVWLQWSLGSLALMSSDMDVSFRGVGAVGLAGTSVSMLSSLSSSMTTSESCWRGLSSTTETLLVLSPSN